MSESTVKVGDRIAFTDGQTGRVYCRVVAKITPTGTIKVGGYQLTPDLRIKGDNMWSSLFASIVTDEIKAKLHRQDIVDQFRSLSHKTNALSNNQIEKCLEILTDGKEQIKCT